MDTELMQKIVALCKRRGFIYPGSEIYGGLSNSWDYGPLGVELKNNIKQAWWKRFIHLRDDIVGLDAALIMNPKVWEASGHIANFADPLVECKKCHERFRADYLKDKSTCPNCGAKNSFTEQKTFNLMFKTFIGPSEETANIAYFRPETAQAIFVDFKNILDTTRIRVPFGIAQTGKAFRNEITPGNFLFRVREFEQMEIEYFIYEDEWEKWFEYWLDEVERWLALIRVKAYRREVPAENRAHYSIRTVDFDFEFPFGREELYGISYRGDFDLINHSQNSAEELAFFDEKTKDKFIPHVIEPTFGVDRTILAILASCYYEDKDRVVLKLPAPLAPVKAAVFPLLANKPQLVEKAGAIFKDLKKSGFNVVFDDRGNIGKRYYAQDEIGTPWCVTVDFQTLEDNTVTIRERDTTKQERVKNSNLISYFQNHVQKNYTR